jgi:hypothetical protein
MHAITEELRTGARRGAASVFGTRAQRCAQSSAGVEAGVDDHRADPRGRPR